MGKSKDQTRWVRVGINVEPELNLAFRSRLMEERLAGGDFVSASDVIRRFMRFYVESGCTSADLEEMFNNAVGDRRRRQSD